MGVIAGAMFITDNLQISQEMLSLISEIDEFKGAWRALGSLAPERLSALRKVATIESIGSSTRIEGSKLTDREVERLLANIEIKSFATRDEQEVAGYAEAMETIFQSWQEIELTENHIKQLHRDLLKYSEKDARHRGQYKTLPNSVEAFDEDGKQVGVVFETATPFDTPRLMRELIEWLNGAELESIIEQNKDGYYLALRQTQGTIRTDAPNWQLWLSYFLRALQKQKQRLAKKVELEKVVLAALPELSVQILDYAREHGRISIGDMIRITGISRNTLKEHFRKLVKRGHLTMHGRGRGAWYALK